MASVVLSGQVGAQCGVNGLLKHLQPLPLCAVHHTDNSSTQYADMKAPVTEVGRIGCIWVYYNLI